MKGLVELNKWLNKLVALIRSFILRMPIFIVIAVALDRLIISKTSLVISSDQWLILFSIYTIGVLGGSLVLGVLVALRALIAR